MLGSIAQMSLVLRLGTRRQCATMDGMRYELYDDEPDALDVEAEMVSVAYEAFVEEQYEKYCQQQDEEAERYWIREYAVDTIEAAHQEWL